MQSFWTARWSVCWHLSNEAFAFESFLKCFTMECNSPWVVHFAEPFCFLFISQFSWFNMIVKGFDLLDMVRRLGGSSEDFECLLVVVDVFPVMLYWLMSFIDVRHQHNGHAWSRLHRRTSLDLKKIDSTMRRCRIVSLDVWRRVKVFAMSSSFVISMV